MDYIKEIDLTNLVKLELVFENCEVVSLYKSDLVKYKLNYYLDNNNYYLTIDSYLIIKLDKNLKRNKKDYFLYNLNNDNTFNLITKRLKENKHQDITCLYIYLESTNNTNKDIKEIKLITPDYSKYLSYKDISVNGICETLSDDTILISFKMDDKTMNDVKVKEFIEGFISPEDIEVISNKKVGEVTITIKKDKK